MPLTLNIKIILVLNSDSLDKMTDYFGPNNLLTNMKSFTSGTAYSMWNTSRVSRQVLDMLSVHSLA